MGELQPQYGQKPNCFFMIYTSHQSSVGLLIQEVSKIGLYEAISSLFLLSLIIGMCWSLQFVGFFPHVLFNSSRKYYRIFVEYFEASNCGFYLLLQFDSIHQFNKAICSSLLVQFELDSLKCLKSSCVLHVRNCSSFIKALEYEFPPSRYILIVFSVS